MAPYLLDRSAICPPTAVDLWPAGRNMAWDKARLPAMQAPVALGHGPTCQWASWPHSSLRLPAWTYHWPISRPPTA